MLRAISKVLGLLFCCECRHDKVNKIGQTSFCPDCGKRTRISWIVLRCKECRNLLIPKYNVFKDVIPLQKHCQSCGSNEWYSVKKDFVPMNETFYSLPIKEVIKEESLKPSTSVWVEKPIGLNSMRKYPKNIIKAKKGLKLDA